MRFASGSLPLSRPRATFEICARQTFKAAFTSPNREPIFQGPPLSSPLCERHSTLLPDSRVNTDLPVDRFAQRPRAFPHPGIANRANNESPAPNGISLRSGRIFPRRSRRRHPSGATLDFSAGAWAALHESRMGSAASVASGVEFRAASFRSRVPAPSPSTPADIETVVSH